MSDDPWVAFREPAAWDERYASERVWSGNVNPQLPEVVRDLTPGTAVDVGCGEGGDVIWLAARGWRATGVDFSPVGLDRAAGHARDAGVAEQCEWLVGDVRDWTPGRTWDLVTAHYLHLPTAEMIAAVRRLAAAVAPGGTLLVVGHHPEDVHSHGHGHGEGHGEGHGSGRPPGARPDLFFAADLVEALDPARWHISAATHARTGTGLGVDVVIRDEILQARLL